MTNKNRDAIICKNIKKHPYNLQLAFKISALEIGICKPSQVQARYYNHIRGKVKLFTLTSSKFKGTNVKTFVQNSSHTIIEEKSTTIQYIIPFNK
jgi:hypothetical protein